MTANEILMPKPMMPLIMDGLKATGRLHCLWEKSDPDAFIRENASKIGAIATGGHIKVDGAYMSQFPNLKIVSNFGVGYDTVDAAWAGQHGIIVSNTPDVLTEEVADTALGLLIMTMRELSQSERYLRDGLWASKGPYPLTHNTLRGKTVGILALGRIGKAIATRCEAFGLKIVYHGRSQQKDVTYPYYPPLVGMAKDVDILLSVAPGGAATFHTINAEVLAALGPYRAIRREHTKRALRLAAELGAPAISTEPGGELAEGQSRAAATDIFYDEIMPCLDVAAECGVTLLIEPEPGLLIEKFDQYLEFAERVDHPSLGLNFDIGHAYCVSEDPAEWVPRMKAHTRHYHFEDIAATRVHHHLVPGEGAIDFAGVFRAIATHTPDMWITVELYPYRAQPDEAARAARGYLLAQAAAASVTIA